MSKEAKVNKDPQTYVSSSNESQAASSNNNSNKKKKNKGNPYKEEVKY